VHPAAANLERHPLPGPVASMQTTPVSGAMAMIRAVKATAR